MGTYKNKAYPLRVNEELMNKLAQIAENEHRTRNKQIEYILEKYVEEYEAKQERAEHKQNLERSSVSKTG